MHLQLFLEERGRGSLKRLHEKTGLSMGFLSEISSRTKNASPEVAQLISDATDGAVPVRNLVHPRVASLMAPPPQGVGGTQNAA